MQQQFDHHMHPLSLIPVLHHLLPFMNDRSIHRLAQCSSDCHQSIRNIKSRELLTLIVEGNKFVGDPLPILQQEETFRISQMIERREKEWGIILPSHLKDFLYICGDFDCPSRWNGWYAHPSNMMLPFEEWELLSYSPIKFPPKRWIDESFERYRRDSFMMIGYLPEVKICLLLDTLTGCLYLYNSKKFTKLISISNWYKSIPPPPPKKLNDSIVEFNNKKSYYSRLEKEFIIGKLLSKSHCHQIYKHLPMELKRDPQIIRAIMKSGFVEPLLPFEYKDNAEFMLEYFRRNVAAFFLCSKRLKFDEDFVEQAFAIDFSMFYISDSKEWNKRGFISYEKGNKLIDSFRNTYVVGKEKNRSEKQAKTLLTTNCKENPPPPINGNTQIVQASVALGLVKKNGMYLYYCSEEIKSDREIVLEAVKSNAFCFEFANERLRIDAEIVRHALSQDPYAIRFISESFLENNRDILIDYCGNHLFSQCSSLIPTKFKSDFQLIRQSILSNPLNYFHLFSSTTTNKKNNSQRLLETFSPHEIHQLRTDKELFIPLILQYPEHISKISRNLPIESIDRDVTIAILFAPPTVVPNQVPSFSRRRNAFRIGKLGGSEFILRQYFSRWGDCLGCYGQQQQQVVGDSSSPTDNQLVCALCFSGLSIDFLHFDTKKLIKYCKQQ